MVMHAPSLARTKTFTVANDDVAGAGFDVYVKFYHSKAIDNMAYSKSSQILSVHFLKTNSVWHYYDVPRDVFNELLVADSVGNCFNRIIRGKFKEERVYPRATVAPIR